MRGFMTVFLAAACALQPALGVAQETTGTLIGAVRDAQGAPLAGATVRVRSKALIGGEQTATTNERGQLRLPALPPGLYAFDVEAPDSTRTTKPTFESASAPPSRSTWS